MRVLSRVLAVSGLLLCSGLAVVSTPAGAASPGPSGPSYVPLVPTRLLESRAGLTTADGLFQGGGPVGSGQTLELTVAGRGGVPSDAAAAVLNITVTGSANAGFLTVWPCGETQPTASSLNYAAGQTIPNAVVAKIGAGGKVCLFAQTATDVLADVNGYFPASSSYRSLVPARVLETRSGLTTVDGQFQGIGRVAAGGTVELTVADRGGVPADASAVVLNVTATGSVNAGFVTVWPCGETQPTASSLNYAAGQTIPNAVVAKVGAGGKVCLFAQTATDLIADVNGYFPAGSGFTPVVPRRVLETRSGLTTADGQFQAIGQVAGGSTLELTVAGRGGVPLGASAVVLNVTATGSLSAGYVTVWPCGETQPTASSLNYAAGQTIPNAVVAKVGAGGKVCLFAQTATDLIADVNGYFGGAAATPVVYEDFSWVASPGGGVNLLDGGLVRGVSPNGRYALVIGATQTFDGVVVVADRDTKQLIVGPNFVTAAATLDDVFFGLDDAVIDDDAQVVYRRNGEANLTSWRPGGSAAPVASLCAATLSAYFVMVPTASGVGPSDDTYCSPSDATIFDNVEAASPSGRYLLVGTRGALPDRIIDVVASQTYLLGTDGLAFYTDRGDGSCATTVALLDNGSLGRWDGCTTDTFSVRSLDGQVSQQAFATTSNVAGGVAGFTANGLGFYRTDGVLSAVVYRDLASGADTVLDPFVGCSLASSAGAVIWQSFGICNT